MIGTVTPAMPPDLRREHAAGVDDDVGADLATLAALLDGHAGHAAAVRRDRRRRACAVGSSRLGRARRPRAPAPARTGRASRRSAARRAPRTPSVDISGNSACASSAPMSSSGSPNVFAQPAWRRSSSNRSFVDASRSEPTSCHDGSMPVSAASRRYSVGAVHHHPGQRHRRSAAARRARPSGTSSPRSAPRDRPGRRRSSRSSARWYAIEVPPTPPPMITARALLHTDRVAAALGSDEEVR